MRYFNILTFITMLIITSCSDNPVTEPDIENRANYSKMYNPAVVVETLSPFVPELPSGYASGMLIEGTGLLNQPGIINLSIPDDYQIEKVFLYWEGRTKVENGGDNTIRVEGIEVEGDLIGQAISYVYSYRADITDLNLNFSNPITISDLEFEGEDHREDGAAIVVIYSHLTASYIEIRDGADFTYLCSGDESVPQTFTFPPMDFTRDAELWFIVGDAEAESRPDEIWVTVNDYTTFYKNLLNGTSGPQLDVVKIELQIPADESEVTVQVISGLEGVCDDNKETNPESLIWMFGGLTIKSKVSECTYTQGFWKNHELRWPVSEIDLGNRTYTQKELLSILKEPVRGNGLVLLARQLIAAKLNIANGSSNTEIKEYIEDADKIIGDFLISPIGEDKLRPNETSKIAEMIDDYNNGLIGPGHCN